MKARLKEESQLATLLSDMKEGQFAVALNEGLEGRIIYRPYSNIDVFAIDLTNGSYWETSPQVKNPKVRILQAGEVIEITE